MLVQTPRQIIETLSQYDPDETLLITWWSAEDVEMVLSDEAVESVTASAIWEEIVDDLDNDTSDHVISHVNAELDARVYEKLEDR